MIDTREVSGRNFRYGIERLTMQSRQQERRHRRIKTAAFLILLVALFADLIARL